MGELAAGGMGTVSLCVKSAGQFERLYAVKRLHAHLREDESMRRMFLDEARVAGLVRHANAVSVLDVGEDADGPFLVMDYVEGASLARLIRVHIETGRSAPAVVCAQIVAQAARGLHAAHELVDGRGRPLELVHRDVSPANILIGRDGIVRVTDFGVAKALGRSTHTSTGLLKGKVGYMAPEHLRFEPLDRRSDLFALGVVLFEVLAGRRLYSADDAAKTARRVLDDPPPDIGDERPDVPPALVELTYELLAKNPADRPATAAEVADRLDEVVAELGHADIAGYLEATLGPALARETADLQQLARQAVPATLVDAAAEPHDDTTRTRAAPRASRRTWVAAALAGAGAVALTVMSMRTDAASPAATVLATKPTEPPAPHVAQFHVATRPAGATLRVDDRDAGTTPLDVELPIAVDPVTLTVSMPGYETTTHELVPEHDERLVITLVPAPNRPPATPHEADASAPPASTPADRPSRARPSPRRSRRSAKRQPDPGPTSKRARPQFRRFD